MPSPTISFSLIQGAEPIPGYVLQEQLGSGGFGEVWKVTAPGGLSKAAKFVFGQVDDQWADEELKALDLVKNLNHPFLLSVERIEIVQGHLVMVTELADSNLRRQFEGYQLSGRPGIPREELVGYLVEMAEALDFLQENYSLAHLDVKPENMLLVGRHAKLADFGLLKKLEETDASSIGALTPKYASPEAFEGNPGRRSDQYSLALVYHELVTGRFPFSVAGSASLASQHLHAKPDLEGLTPSEQFAVGKALSKDPSDRFASCSEFMARLQRRTGRSMFLGTQGNDELPSHVAPPPAAPELPLASPETPTACHDGHTVQVDIRSMYHDGQTAEVAMPEAHCLPSPPMADTPVAYRPALFIGIGGTGGRILGRLRGLLRDRFPDAEAIPSLQFLYLDTDAHAINAVLNAPEDEGLHADEIVHLPLRSPSDYRSRPLGGYQSISRRWLYNIPRSLRTEGIRPLGRIAFLDHVTSILNQLRTTLFAATSQDATEATGKETGLPFHVGDPRVFLVTSISGGTGSGMIIDVAYAVRQLLAESGFTDEHMSGFLTYTGTAYRRSSCLEAANAYATLDEMRFFSLRQNDYPGEQACGLAGFRENRCPLTDTYFVEMQEERYDEQVREVAKYLFLNAVSPASAFFDGCRLLDRAEPECEGEDSELRIRSIGVLPLSVDSSKVGAAHLDEVCRLLIRRWQGGSMLSGHEADEPESRQDLRRWFDQEREPHEFTPTSDDWSPERWADALFSSIGLHPQGLHDQTTEALAVELRSDPKAYLTAQITDFANHKIRGRNVRASALAAIIVEADRMLGDPDDPAPDALRGLTMRYAAQMADNLKAAIYDQLLGLAAEPGRAIADAARATEHIQSLVKRLEQKTHERREVARRRGDEFVKVLANLASRKNRGKAVTLDSLMPRFAEYADLLLEQALCDAACRTVTHLKFSARSLAERLHGVTRFLDRIILNFESDADGADKQWQNDLKEISAHQGIGTINEIFAQRLPEMVDRLEGEVRASFFSDECTLRDLFEDNGTISDRLIAFMRHVIRPIVIRTLKDAATEQVAEAAKSGDAPASSLTWAKFMESVTPTSATNASAGVRYLVTGPDAAMLSSLKKRLQQDKGEEIKTLYTPERDVLLCCEMEPIEFDKIVSPMMRSQPECKELAGRLHTRINVNW